jgi:hypothetical protein
MAGLLVLLAAVASYGIPRIVSEGADAVVQGCSPGAVPGPARLTVSAIEHAVTSSGLSSLVGHGSLDIQGFQEPSAAWSDDPPPSNPTSSPPAADSRVDAGYEIRWWSPANDHPRRGLLRVSQRGRRRTVRTSGSVGSLPKGRSRLPAGSARWSAGPGLEQPPRSVSGRRVLRPRQCRLPAD